MSVTISTTTANISYVRQTCPSCKGSGVDGVDPNGDAYKCYWCNGEGNSEEWVSDSPELNIANGSARRLFALLGVDGGECLCGGVSHEDLPALSQSILSALNRPSERARVTSPPSEEGGETTIVRGKEGDLDRVGRTCRVFNSGYDDGRIRRYLTPLSTVVRAAQEAGGGLCWG